jgi:hypothetical protein
MYDKRPLTICERPLPDLIDELHLQSIGSISFLHDVFKEIIFLAILSIPFARFKLLE